MNVNEAPIMVEQVIRRHAEIVWDAITDINQMRQWYFVNIPAFEPEVGFETRFDVQSQSRIFRHIWNITKVVPGKLITYNWKYDGIPGDSFVSFELFKQDSSTLLRLTHVVLESFPDDISEFSRESGLQGWTFFIKERLRNFLEKDI